MKTIKYIGQLLAALIYSPIYVCILFVTVVLPFAWLLSLSTKWMIIALFFLSGIVECLVLLVRFIGLIPYVWILDKNKYAAGLSATICALLPLRYMYDVWVRFLNFGTTGIVAAIIISIFMLQAVIMTVMFILGKEY